MVKKLSFLHQRVEFTASYTVILSYYYSWRCQTTLDESTADRVYELIINTYYTIWIFISPEARVISSTRLAEHADNNIASEHFLCTGTSVGGSWACTVYMRRILQQRSEGYMDRTLGFNLIKYQYPTFNFSTNWANCLKIWTKTLIMFYYFGSLMKVKKNRLDCQTRRHCSQHKPPLLT